MQINKKLNEFNTKLQELCMLNHDFYKILWNEGKLSNDDLKYYAQQYYFIEENFINCLQLANNIYSFHNKFTKIINENIKDETGHGDANKSHLKLWLKFCKFLNTNEKEINCLGTNQDIKLIINEVKTLITQSLPSAVGLFYSYEHQIPAIADSKINGLIKHYNAKENSEELTFFNEHKKADVWHTAQWEKIIKTFNENECKEFKESTIKGMKLLLQFLDIITKERKLECNYYNN